ncbi:MAG: hypothetical protein ACLQUW_08030 [Desulfobaccales bacterium]
MIHTAICTYIEGERLYLQCRQFNPLKPCINPTTGNAVYPFKMAISSKAIIGKELNPKESIFRVESITDKDSCIKGQTINGFSVRPLGATEIIHTGGHRGRFIITKGISLAHIEIGFRALLEKKDKK